MDDDGKAVSERTPEAGPGAAAFANPFLWPLVAAVAASDAAALFVRQIAGGVLEAGIGPEPGREPCWSTPNRIVLELPTMRLRDFSAAPQTHAQTQQPATVICAPFALHDASVVDFAPGHSLVETLLPRGGRLLVTDWRSATLAMRDLAIDHYLADLNVAVDEAGAPADLIGLCQGGWLALMYAARFPDKVRKLVLAGAPVDLSAGRSQLSQLAADLPFEVFEELVRAGRGLILGQAVRTLWSPMLGGEAIEHVLQLPHDMAAAERAALEQRFQAWDAATVNLPGAYYLQVVRELFKDNRLARGTFVALGRTLDLARVRHPLFLLAARDDELVHPDQLFALAHQVATPAAEIETASEPCGHLGLFLGAGTLVRPWRRVVQWLDASGLDASGLDEPQARSAAA